MRLTISSLFYCSIISFTVLMVGCVSRTEETSTVVSDSTSATTATAGATETRQSATAVPVDNTPALNTTYRLVTKKDNIRGIVKRYSNLPALLVINRTDSANIAKLDTLVLPADSVAGADQFSPFPASLPFLGNVRKIVFFSYPAQYFAAYENGRRVYTGPTNMGRQKDQTPTGLFFSNWKSEKTTSTFNDEWELKWNFNIDNKEGVGWHQYAMPGYPASHSCLRLIPDFALGS